MIWLTGNEGMLGTELEEILKKEKVPYTATDMNCDITDYKTVKAFVKDKNINWIINCAAYTAVDKAEDEIDAAFNINVKGPENLAVISKEINTKLIHISTDYVFSGDKKYPYKENDEIDPKGVYGKSKAEGEKAIRENADRYFIIRTAWLYGKNRNNFVHTMLRLFKEKESINVVSDQYGSPTYAKDLAWAIFLIIKNNSDKYGIYHFSNKGKTSWYKFAKEIYKKANNKKLLNSDCRINPVSTDEYPVKAPRPKNSLLSKNKIIKELKIPVPLWKKSLNSFLEEIK